MSKFIQIAFIFLMHANLNGACCPKKNTQGPPGPPGPPGLSELPHLYTFNDFAAPLLPIPAGDYVPFVGAIKGSGSSIIKDSVDPTLFTITKKGNYLISVVGHVIQGNQGGIRLIVNGNPTENPGVPPTFDSSPVVHQEVIFVSAVPASLRVEVTGTQLDFHPGASATISISQLSSFSTKKKK